MTPIALAMGLAQYAPAAIRWLTNSEKAADAAERVVEIAEVVTGEKGPDALRVIQDDPKLAAEFHQAVAQREAELDKEYLLDRQDARKRDVALAEAGRNNYRADILAVLAVGALVLCVWFVASSPDLPSGAREAIMFVAGVFAAAVRDVYGFEFGSSRGSKEKDSLIHRITGNDRS